MRLINKMQGVELKSKMNKKMAYDRPHISLQGSCVWTHGHVWLFPWICYRKHIINVLLLLCLASVLNILVWSIVGSGFVLFWRVKCMNGLWMSLYDTRYVMTHSPRRKWTRVFDGKHARWEATSISQVIFSLILAFWRTQHDFKFLNC